MATYEDYLARGDTDLGGASGSSTEERNRDRLARIEEEVTHEIDTAAEKALASRESEMPSPETAGFGVYAQPSTEGR